MGLCGNLTNSSDHGQANCLTSIGVRAPSDFGGGGGGDFLAQKNYAIPESVRVEIGMQTQTFTIGKIVKLKACILNSINSLSLSLIT